MVAKVSTGALPCLRTWIGAVGAGEFLCGRVQDEKSGLVGERG